MRDLFRIISVCIVMVTLTILAGCDATTETLDPAAEETARIDQITKETLSEVEQLTRTYDNIMDEAGKTAGVVYVPAGSNDELAAALAQAGSRGIVILASGDHYESGTVAITERVILVGEPGARLIVDTQPRPVVPRLHPALHVTDAAHVAIWGLEIVPQGDVGGTAILAERAPNLLVGRTHIREHQVGVLLQHSDHARIIHNRMEMSTASGIAGRVGVHLTNGAHAVVVSNTVSSASAGMLLCDKHGKLIRNEVSGNALGIAMTRLTDHNQLTLPSGEILSADNSATGWIVNLNNSHANAWGYLIINGASQNLVARTNRASNNASYDIELAGDTERFGTFYPSTFENTVLVGDPDMTVKDCGMNNTVHGGTVIDTDADACF